MSADRVYVGTRVDGIAAVTVLVAGKSYNLNLQLHVRNHSPTGPEWGYGGSGPSQLALALLINATGDVRRSLNLYHQFKWAVIGRLPHAGWTLTREEVLAEVARLEALEEVDLRDCLRPPRSILSEGVRDSAVLKDEQDKGQADQS